MSRDMEQLPKNCGIKVASLQSSVKRCLVLVHGDCLHSSVLYVIPSDILFAKFGSLAVFAPNQDLYIKSWSVPQKNQWKSLTTHLASWERLPVPGQILCLQCDKYSPQKHTTLTWYNRHLRRTQGIYQPTIHKGRQRYLGHHRWQDTRDVLSYQVSHGQYLGQWINELLVGGFNPFDKY